MLQYNFHLFCHIHLNKLLSTLHKNHNLYSFYFIIISFIYFNFKQLYIFLILYSTEDFFIILLISKNHKTKKVLSEVYYE